MFWDVQDVAASLGLAVAAAAIRFDYLTYEYAVFLSLNPITRATIRSELEPGYYISYSRKKDMKVLDRLGQCQKLPES